METVAYHYFCVSVRDNLPSVDGVFLPVRMRHYIGVSEQLRAVMDSFTPFVEPLSLDEAFLDVSGVMRH